MSTRLQVVVEQAELEQIRRAAAAEGVTVSAWVRQAIRAAQRAGSTTAPARKLELIRFAAEHAFPAGDIETMLSDIEQGYADGAQG